MKENNDPIQISQIPWDGVNSKFSFGTELAGWLYLCIFPLGVLMNDLSSISIIFHYPRQRPGEQGEMKLLNGLSTSCLDPKEPPRAPLLREGLFLQGRTGKKLTISLALSTYNDAHRFTLFPQFATASCWHQRAAPESRFGPRRDRRELSKQLNQPWRIRRFLFFLIRSGKVCIINLQT